MKANRSFSFVLYFEFGEIERLQKIPSSTGHLLPQGVRIKEVWLDIRDNQAELHYSFYGRKPDGTEHQRRTNDFIRWTEGGSEWLFHLLAPPPGKSQARSVYEAAMALWPTKKDVK